jgi:hypothetical protein
MYVSSTNVDEVATLRATSGNEVSAAAELGSCRAALVTPPPVASAGGQLCAVTRPSCQVQPLVHSNLLNRACAKLCFHSNSPSIQ